MQSTVEAEKCVRQYLSAIAQVCRGNFDKGYKYRSPSELLLDKGEKQGGEDKEVDPALVKLIKVTGYDQPKMCFYNCMLLSSHAEWDYCEGLVMRGDLGIPVDHAWLLLDGMVYDPTLRIDHRAEDEVEERLAHNNRTNYYFGVKLDKELALESLYHRKLTYAVLQDYEKNYPVLMENSPWLMK